MTPLIIEKMGTDKMTGVLPEENDEVAQFPMGIMRCIATNPAAAACFPARMRPVLLRRGRYSPLQNRHSLPEALRLKPSIAWVRFLFFLGLASILLREAVA